MSSSVRFFRWVRKKDRYKKVWRVILPGFFLFQPIKMEAPKMVNQWCDRPEGIFLEIVVKNLSMIFLTKSF